MEEKNVILGGDTFSVDFIKNNNVNFPQIKQVQLSLLNAYRLTDEYRQAYGEYLIAKYPNGLGVTSGIEAIKKFKNVENVDMKKDRALLIDLLYSIYVLGFTKYEYFCYGFENKTISERLKFMSNSDIFHYYGILNEGSDDRKILGNKYFTYEKFKDFFKRDLIKLDFKNDQKMFFDFCKKHPKFIVKPIGGAMGRKIEIIDTNNYNSLEDAYKYLTKFKTKIVCEELIIQHPALGQFHENSVNSIRFFTYFNGKESKVVCAWFKIGQGNAIVDNGGSGGIVAAIDKETGVVISDGGDENANSYVTHPNSGIKFKGFKIDKWQELIDMALKIAEQLPGVPLVGWDFALSKDKGWQLIEGNEQGQIFVIQIGLKEGCKEEFEEAFEWEKWKQKALLNKLKNNK